MEKKNLNYFKGVIQIKQGENKITVVASDETLDRHGDVLPIESWDLTKFKSAPRMLVDHDHQVSSIVGKWENVRIEGKQLLMDANFHGITELSKAVQRMVMEKYLDTVSVGFIPHGPTKDGGNPTFELIETSWVTVPANPSARVQASLKALLEKQADDSEIAKVKEYMGKDLEEEEEIESDPEEVEPPVGPMNDEEIEKKLGEMGMQVCKSAVDIRNVTDKKLLVVDAKFALKLLEDSEKLLTLTQATSEASLHRKLILESMKEAARIVNHSLRDLKKVP